MTRSTSPRAPIARVRAALATTFALISLLVAARPDAQVARAATRPVTFASPVVVDAVHAYGEPIIRMGLDGDTHVSGPWGTGTQRSIWNQSLDGGQTFHPVHSPPMATPNESDTQIPCPTEEPQCPGGGDTEKSVLRSGEVWFSDLAALVTLKMARWNPNTRTMETMMFGNGTQNANGIDRQWFALWDPPNPDRVRLRTGYTGPLPVNYLAVAEAVLATSCESGNCESATYSTNGITYSPNTVTWEMANDGPLTIDQQTGTVFEAISVESTRDVGVAIVTRDPDNPSDPALRHAEIVKIADLPEDTTTRALFPVAAMDGARNLYMVWVTRGASGVSVAENPNAWQIFYSYSTAASHWRTWSTPRQISSPPSNTNIMPWVTAGTDGRIAAVWYGTDDTTHAPGTEDAHQAWDVYMAMLSNADTASPTVNQYRVTPHHIHYGTICIEGTGCILSQGNRNNADFFSVTTDPRDGAPVITYNDTSNELTQEHIGQPIEGIVDHRGAPVVMTIRQATGIGLWGTPVSKPPVPVSSTFLKDRAGDARWDPIYGLPSDAVPQLDLLGASVRADGDNLIFRFHVKRLKNLAAALAQTGAGALEYVMRWTGEPIEDPDTGTRDPIYYVAVEVDSEGVPHYFAGEAISVELCSVSGCFPHIIDYPMPPRCETERSSCQEVNGHRESALGHDHFELVVPRSAIGNPADGSTFDSFSAFTFARNKSSALPLTNSEGEGGITPAVVDAVCCSNALIQTTTALDPH